MTVTNRPTGQKKKFNLCSHLLLEDGRRALGDGDSVTQKRTHGTLPDTVRGTKKSSTPVASGTTVEKGASDQDKATTNRNLAQGKESDVVRSNLGEDLVDLRLEM
jgi:hypothetical protein